MIWRSRADDPGSDPPRALGQLGQLGADGRRDRRRVRVQLPQDVRDDAPLLLDEREQQVLGRDFGMSFAVGELLRAGDRFLGLVGVLLNVHDCFLTVCSHAWR